MGIQNMVFEAIDQVFRVGWPTVVVPIQGGIGPRFDLNLAAGESVGEGSQGSFRGEGVAGEVNAEHGRARLLVLGVPIDAGAEVPGTILGDPGPLLDEAAGLAATEADRGSRMVA